MPTKYYYTSNRQYYIVAMTSDMVALPVAVSPSIMVSGYVRTYITHIDNSGYSQPVCDGIIINSLNTTTLPAKAIVGGREKQPL